MQKIIFLLFAALLFVSFLNAQKTIPDKPRIYTIKVSGDSAKRLPSGYLAWVSDLSIFISPATVYFTGYESGIVNSARIDYNNLGSIQLRRKGSAGRGVLKGTIYGSLAGALLGAVTYNKPKNEVEDVVFKIFGINRTTTTVSGAMTGGLAGALIGGIIGAVAHKTFVINGRKENFDAMKSKLIN